MSVNIYTYTTFYFVYHEINNMEMAQNFVILYVGSQDNGNLP